MSAVLVFLAGALSAPQADRAFATRVQQHYPQWALRDRQQTSSVIELATLPDGSVSDCIVHESVGNERLAAEACAGTVGLKLEPASDGDGNPAYGLLRTTITLTLSPAATRLRPLVPGPDVELTVNRLPDDTVSLDVTVALLVSAEGSVGLCGGQTPREGKPPPAAYVNLACQQATGWRGRVLRDGSGTAIPYVTNMRVRFSPDEAASTG